MEKHLISEVCSHPLLQYRAEVRPDWIDRNDHMNNSFYLLISQEACLHSIRAWRGDAPSNGAGPFGNFITQALVTYIREIRRGTLLTIQCRLANCDAKRALVYAEMINSENGKLAATVERTSVNVIRAHPPKAAPYPTEVYANLRSVEQSHSGVPYLEGRSPVLALNSRRTASPPAA